MAPENSDGRFYNILLKYPFSEYVNIPKSFQLVSEATVLHALLCSTSDLDTHVSAERIREYLEQKEEDRLVFLECWKTGDFDRVLQLDGVVGLIKQSKRSENQQLVIQGGTFKEIHGDNYEITVGEDDQPILNWLCPVDYTTIQRDTYRRRAEDTGAWFVQHAHFQKWLSGQGGHILWCPGLPGAGKTILASVAVNYLQRTQDAPVCYVYFDYKRQKDQTPSLVLGSLARQLYRQVPYTRETFKRTFQSHENEHPTENMLSRLLKEAIRSMEYGVFIVLDALDEFLESYRDAIISRLLDKILDLGSSVRLMATSRVLGGMEAMFKSRNATRLEICGGDADIEVYAKNRILDEIPFAQRITDDIVARVTEASGRRFLQAKLHIDYLCSLLNVGEIRDALSLLTSNIDDAYGLVLERINGQSQQKILLAHRALAWILYAHVPLTRKQLAEALATARGRVDIEDYLTPVDVITGVCAGLLTIEEGTKYVGFTHMTVFEYFQRNPSYLQVDVLFIARACMDHITSRLSIYVTVSPDAWQRKGLLEDSFIGYAIYHWGYHCAEVEEALCQDIIDFLDDERVVRAITGPILGYPSLLEVDHPQTCDGIDDGDHLHVAAYFGLQRTLIILLERGHSVNVQATISRMTPLAFAVAYGPIRMVETFLSLEGVDVNLQNIKGLSPLGVACYRGDIHIVELLLKHNEVDTSLKDVGGWTMLEIASSCGNVSIMKTLLDSGTREGIHNSLTLAIRQCQVEVADALLNAGANPSKSDSPSLLPPNRLDDNSAIIENVLKVHPSAIRSPRSDGEPLIFHAIDSAHPNIVKVLLQSGLTSPEEKDSRRRSILSMAFRGQRRDVIDLIWDFTVVQGKGTYSESKDQRGRTEFSYAAQACSVFHMKALLETGNVDINQVDEHGRSPLSYTAGYQRSFNVMNCADGSDAMKYLIENGAQCDLPDATRRTPLFYAAEQGNDDMIRILLEAGVDPNSTDNIGRTPLSYAVTGFLGAPKAIHHLLQYHANANQADVSGRTPLSYAAGNGHHNILGLLVKHGADLNAADIEGRTALSYASEFRHKLPVSERFDKAVNVLLGLGADISIRDIQGKSALDYALAAGRRRSTAALQKKMDIEGVTS